MRNKIFDNSTDISDSSTGITEGSVLHSINIPAPFTFVISVTRIAPVDEPGTLLLLGLSFLGLGLR